MPQFDIHSSCFGCRAKCKGLDPCAQGAKTTQCAACSALTEEQWSHLRENFAKRQRTGSQGSSFEEPETEDPAQTGEDLSRVDDTLLDLEPEETSTGAPLAGNSPLTSLPAPLPAQNVPATSLTMGAVNQPTDPSPALFRAPHPMSQTVTQDILPPGFIPHSTPGRHSVADRMAAMSFPQPQRAVSTTEIPQTPRTQLIRSQLEQQNFEMMNKVQEKNQQQIQDLSAQLQTGLQAFLQQSMEQMFNRLAPAQTQPPVAASSTLPPHIVSITPVSAIPPAKSEEPMDAAPSEPPPFEVKKGFTKVKGSSAIAQQSIQAVVQSHSTDFHPLNTVSTCDCVYSKAFISSSSPGTRGLWD